MSIVARGTPLALSHVLLQALVPHRRMVVKMVCHSSLRGMISLHALPARTLLRLILAPLNFPNQKFCVAFALRNFQVKKSLNFIFSSPAPAYHVSGSKAVQRSASACSPPSSPWDHLMVGMVRLALVSLPRRRLMNTAGYQSRPSRRVSVLRKHKLLVWLLVAFD